MTRAKTLFALLLLISTIFFSALQAQTSYTPAPENLNARQEFQDAKFGMFIHWGVYSVLGDGEWVFHNRKLTVHEYELLPKFFDPEKFDAKAWVALAKAAGMKYITITSREARLESFGLEYRTAHPICERSAEDAGRRGAPAGNQAVLLLLAIGLAQSGLLSARRDGGKRLVAQREARSRRLECVSG
jgi:hypothetical protein